MVKCRNLTKNIVDGGRGPTPLIAMIDFLTVQSSAQTFIHNAIVFIDTPNNALYNQAHWFFGTPYLSMTTVSLCEKIITLEC